MMRKKIEEKYMVQAVYMALWICNLQELGFFFGKVQELRLG
jgi:hypothetical protein